jgi:hypothetical protein
LTKEQVKRERDRRKHGINYTSSGIINIRDWSGAAGEVAAQNTAEGKT